jgi:hypothetical protein
MNWYKPKRNNNDILFSKFIRTRDGWKCQYRFKCYGGVDYRSNPQGLHCSHFQKRGKWTTRYDPLNCDAACAACHNFVENDPDGQKTLEAWKLRQLGEQKYKALLIRANTTGRKDPKLDTLYVKQLLKELE